LQSVNDQRNKLLEEKSEELWEREEAIFDLYQPDCIPNFSLSNLPSTNIGFLIGNKFQVFIRLYRGFQDCPWGGKHDYWSSFTFLILNRQSGKFVTCPGLIVHLIRKHHFFEGIETPFRVNPARIAEVLELAAETE
jgi:hypothetical protein